MKPNYSNIFFKRLISVYQKDKSTFWYNLNSSFLSDQFSLSGIPNRLRLGIELMSLYLDFKKKSKEILNEFSAQRGINIGQWKSNRKSYMNDAFPVFIFLAIWMDEMQLHHITKKFDDIIKAGVLAVSGYGILDYNLDDNQSVQVEIITANALIAEFEHRCFSIFGFSETNATILHKMRMLFYDAEIKEKACRFKKNPYQSDKPENCGAKGANSVIPFMLCLSHLNKETLIDAYWKVFMCFGAAIQILDDWKDLDEDLEHGHYSFITIGFENEINSKNLKSISKALKSDITIISKTYNAGIQQINIAKSTLNGLNDSTLLNLVEMVEKKFRQFYRQELKYDNEKMI